MSERPGRDGAVELATTPADPAFLGLVTAVLASGARVRFRASGWSMAPTILDGDAITVEPTPAEQLRPGDVVLCRSARGAVAHRLVSRALNSSGESVLSLQGDAAEECDPPVAAGDVLGRVVEATSGVRTVAVSSWRARSAACLRRAVRRLRARLAR